MIKSKSKKLREMLKKKDKIIRIVGAHNGMSAKLVEEAGFEGIWASGLEVSTSHAVPDANILTMTDYLNAAIDMNDAVSIPVIVDADTGYGNSNNVIHMVKKFEDAGIAGVCIEDKKFPKVNSFIPGRQELASIAEFVGKIMAGKNAQRTDSFCLFARVEALIAGWGLEEALKRAHAYVKAGADGIFIHSKSKQPDEIMEFIKAWDGSAPLIICPTTYPSLTVEEARKTGKVKIYIFANQGIRAAIKSMQEVFKTLAETGDIRKVEDKIASMKKVFEIQGMPQMKENEKKYLIDREKIQVLIPAARENRALSLKDILRDRPLALLDINGKSLLQRNLEILYNLGLQDITLITGYCKEKLQQHIETLNTSVKLIENKDYDKKGILHSIMCAKDKIKEKVLIIFSDILFEKNILERLLKREEDIVLVIDCSYREIKNNGKSIDLVKTKLPAPSGDRIVGLDRDNPIVKIGHNLDKDEATHEFIGMILFSKKGFEELKKIYEELLKQPPTGKFHEAPSFEKADLTDILQEMLDRGYILHSLEINKGWMEIYKFEDYKKACEMIK